MQLNQGRQDLPDEVKKYVDRIKRDSNSGTEIVHKLYDYLQNNTRYILITLGIGGFQAMSAQEVAEKGYGDCKGLTNYMYAMLKHAGIEAYPVIIQLKRKSLKIDPDFPENLFNHIVLLAKTSDGDIWLECTSSKLKLGELGISALGKLALLADTENSRLIETPPISEYLEKSKLTFHIDL